MKKNNYLHLLIAGIIMGTAGFMQAQTITTIAGNQVAGYSGDGAQATAAEIHNPMGIARDASGNIYIADDYNNVIRKVNTSGVISTFAGNGTYNYSGDNGPATAAEIGDPQGVAVDASGNVYIADKGNNRIRMVDGSGTITTYAGTGTAGFFGDGGAATAAQMHNPDAVAIDPSGNLYIADLTNDRIRKVNTGGVMSTFAGNGTKGYSGDGGPATAAEIYYCYALGTDASGNVYIGDQANHRLRKVNSSGVISTIAGTGTAGYSGDGGPATAADLDFITGITADAVGNIYFSDASTQYVRIVFAGGGIATIAGIGTAGYSGDGGPATAAELHNPYGLVMASGGVMYVAEDLNNDVRKITGITSVDEIAVNNSVRVYPNPSNGIFNIQITNYKPVISGMIEVYNLGGEKVYNSRINNPSQQINLSNNAKGIYLYRICNKAGEVISSGRVVIE